MSDPDDAPTYAHVHTASSASEAEIVRALLEGAGIPSHVEGLGLADEVGVAQRAMGSRSTRVFVPSTAFDEAEEILNALTVNEDELERQAIAAADDSDAELETGPEEEVDGLVLPKPRFLSPRVAALILIISFVVALLLSGRLTYWRIF